MKEVILILDDNGKNNQLLAKKIRSFGVYSLILPYNTKIGEIRKINPKGIILLGNNKKVPKTLINLNIPILTYGIIEDTNKENKKIYMNDYVYTDDNKKDNKKLKIFIKRICKCRCNWNMRNFMDEQINLIKEKVQDKKVLLALSGGVDSSVLAVLISKAIGKNLTCIFVDHGFLRKYEPEEVEEVFTKRFNVNFIKIDAKKRFLKKLKSVTNPEQKRKLIGEEFIRVFEDESKKLGKINFLAQGTIYPDIIESGIGKNKVIKSHHNVGGLPSKISFDEILEPLKDLFKDEVRKLGLELGLPEDLVYRQPFPGPGLAVRVLGELTEEKLNIVKDADLIFREEIKKAKLNRKINQYFAVLTNMKTVGIKNEERSYEYTIALRAVDTIDFMTAKAHRIPHDILEVIVNRIINEVVGVNRVVYDITPKPTSTIEYE